MEITKTEYIEIIKNIFDYFKAEDEKSQLDDISSEKIYMDSEFDSNQTTFEEMSNQGDIAVIADSDKKGFIMLLFLRMIIDNNLELCKWRLEEENISITNIESIIECIYDYMYDESKIHPADKPIEIILQSYRKTTHITVNPYEIDLWTMERIQPILSQKLQEL